MKKHILLLLLLVAACVASPGAAQRRGGGTTHTVIVDATSFTPAKLTIKPGDSVIWRNRDLIPHTATAAAKGGFDSGTLKSGDSWKFTFKNKGTFSYVCNFHPTMKGAVVVSP